VTSEIQGDSRVILAKDYKIVKCRDVGLDVDGMCYVITPAKLNSEEYVDLLEKEFGDNASKDMRDMLEVLEARAMFGDMLGIKGQRVETVRI